MAYTTIDDPSAHFQSFLYTGNQSSRNITLDGNSDLQPDLYWYKARNSNHHYWVDSSRGTTKYLYSSLANAEATVASAYVTSFNTNGFNVGGGDSGTNANGISFANWAWKANGGTTSSNTDGSITSTVQANQDAGFSIVTYTGTGANATVGHGLGVTPNIVFYKNRTDSGITGSTNANWIVQSSALNVDEYIKLNETAAAATDTGYFRSTRPSSTVLTLGTYNSNNGSSDNLIAYCFAEKQGYSKFGKYVGNGNANGTFIYTGFKPAWVMIKRTTGNGTHQWYIYDNKRDEANVMEQVLQAQGTNAEITSSNILDFLSNGFKQRSNTQTTNTSGASYIYMAFAENPFVTSTGIPTTAR